MSGLEIRGLTAGLGSLEILQGVDIEVPFGEVHALMGPNGSGKSTLCHALMGKPEYEVAGSAMVDGVELLGSDVNERVENGLFATFQYPTEIPGVTLRDLLREMADGHAVGSLDEASRTLGVDQLLDRAVNVGLSGGEMKRSEMLQLVAIRPKAVVLDEIDSGLDVDAVRQVAAAVEEMRSPERAVLLITHYSRILQYLTIDKVHIMLGGRIARSGGRELADELEAKGYETLRQELGLAEPVAKEADPFP